MINSITPNLLDCTLRDGGYYNNWNFSKSLIDDYLSKISKTNITHIELGFRFFKKDYPMGLTAYTDDKLISSLNIPSNKYHEFYGCQDELIIESKIRAEQIRLEEAKKPKHKYYIVRRGDCLPIIARKFGITVAQLKSWNNLRGSLIYPNQRLRISN